MDLQTLSSLDDLLSDVLLDGVHLWFQTHKMSKDYQPLCLPQEAILRIIQKRVIIDRRVPDAVKELLEIDAIAERLNNERLLQNFQVHARRYLNVYLPSAGFEISQTDRYSALTNKSEACVIATRVFEAGHELRFCAGSIANLTIQEERDLEKKTSDFSVIRTSRRGTCLFLGPARFVNHDCDPNCNFMPVGADVICFKALKSIDINEEITTYYGDNYFGVGNQECLCATCERLGRGRYRTINDVAEAVQTISPSNEAEEGPFTRRLRTRSTNPPCYTRPRLKKPPSSTKPSAKYNSIAPVESDTVSNAIQPRHVQHAGAFVHRLLSPNSTHEYEGSSSWLQIGSGELALGYGDASESCRANSPVPMELSSHQLHSLHDDGANSQHVPQSPACEDADVSLAARTSLALGFHVLPDSVSDLSLVMDSATDTSGSSLSTPPYTESNSDVDIDGDEKGGDKSNRGNANLLQSVRSRMSIAFLCHDSSPSPSPSPGLITRKQSSPHISTCSVNALEDRGRTSMSTIDFHKLESTNGVAKPIEPSPGSMDEPIENKQCPTCKNNFRKQERSPTADCERCHRHLSIYGVRWPSRSNGVLKEKMAKLEQAQVRNAERARRRREAASKALRHQQRRRMVSMKRAQFTAPPNVAGSRATSMAKHPHAPVSSILEHVEQLHQPELVPYPSGHNFIQHRAAISKIITPATSAKRSAMSGADPLGNITPGVISSVDKKRTPPRKPTVHFVRHHVHVRVARIPRGIKESKESDPDGHERRADFKSHRIMTERVAIRFAAVPGLLFRRTIDGNSTLAALGHSPGFYADVPSGVDILSWCVPRSKEPRRCYTGSDEDRTRDSRLFNPSEMPEVSCSVFLPKVQTDPSKEFQPATKGRGDQTRAAIKRKRSAAPPSQTPSATVQAKQAAPLPKYATSTIQYPSLLELPETSSILNQPSGRSETSDLSQNISQDDVCSFALEPGSQSGSNNLKERGTCSELGRLMQLDIMDSIPLLDAAVSTAKRKALDRDRIQKSLIMNPSPGLDPYWSDSRTEAKNNVSESTSTKLSTDLESPIQPICKRAAQVQGSTVPASKRKALQNLLVDGVLEPCRKKRALERQREHQTANVTLSCPQHRTQDTMLFPKQNHDLRQNSDAPTADHGTPMTTPTRKTTELDRLSQWTIKEQVPSYGRRRAAPRRQAVEVPEMNSLEAPSSQDLTTIPVNGQKEQLASSNSENYGSGLRPCATITVGIDSRLVPHIHTTIDQTHPIKQRKGIERCAFDKGARGTKSRTLLSESCAPQESMVSKPRLAFQDKQPTLESGATLTESEPTILSAKLLVIEAHPTITEPATAVSEPAGPKQHSPEEADLHVNRQDDGYETRVAGTVPSRRPLQNLSKKLQSSLASDQHPPQEPEAPNLKRGSLHVRGGNRLSELEQLQLWTIKNSEPVHRRRTLALQ